MPGHYGMSMQPSAISTASAPTKRSFRGSITGPTHSLSTLRSAGYPVATQDLLPAGGQPLPGGADYPLGPSAQFQDGFPLPSIPSAQACLAHLELTP